MQFRSRRNSLLRRKALGRCRAISPLGHELIEFSFVLRRAQPVEEVTKFALLFFEPRINVLDVGVRSTDGGQTLLIVVDYQVRATNNVFNIVYPFYLERSRA